MRYGCILLLLSACASTSTFKPEETDAPTDDPAGTDLPDDDVTDAAPTDVEPTDDEDAPASCHTEPRNPDRERVVLYNHPYNADADKAYTWVARTLRDDDTLGPELGRVESGRAYSGEVVFTPDGDIALTTFEDGSIGSFSLDGPGIAAVDVQLTDAYASGIVLAADGTHGWVIDGNWPNNGGGLYAIELLCDGRFTVAAAPTVPGKLIERGRLVPGRRDRMVFAGGGYADAAPDDDLFLVDAETGALLDSLNLFEGEDPPIVSGFTVTPDGLHVVVGDISEFSDIGARYAVASITGDRLAVVNEVRGGDPVAIGATPFGDGVVILDGYANSLAFHPYDPAADPPVGRGVIPRWVGRAPELPSALSFVTRGAQKGRLVVAENSGVRLFRADGAGALVDLGRTTTGSGFEGIVGIVGVQP